ncbi:hypothetical protein BDV26DRAFT_276640 [Aspergillus bertholletiae]|uniref:Uncharacterized protein n=1 Tax=Aspergillus bertholletiae TaxID=1226010 RepID=A0A5N7AMU0_9EURO|nr:hypothetical protein BDV26DRAFT_276640 [Aspergillus bertholletiae]
MCWDHEARGPIETSIKAPRVVVLTLRSLVLMCSLYVVSLHDIVGVDINHDLHHIWLTC